MKVDAISNINEARLEQLVNRTVIVIDVLRATSSIVVALENGSSGVMPVKTVQQAKQAKQEGDLLAGERFCKKISGFDLGNSPTEFLNADLEGRRIILTTTNGTRVIDKACKAAFVMAGSFLNAQACAKAAMQLGRDTMIICAGTQDKFSMEDGLCAGLIAAELDRIAAEQLFSPPLIFNDFAKAMHWSYMHQAGNLKDALLHCENGARLTKLGYREDVLYCTNVNQSGIVPVLKDRVMTALK